MPKRESDAATRALEQLEALIKRSEPQTTLVFVATSVDKRRSIFKVLQKQATVVECGSPEDAAAAERWVRTKVADLGIEIDPAGARALAVLAGFPDRPSREGKTGQLGRLRGDVDRLLLYALGQKRITADDVRELAGPAVLRDDWAMANAIESVVNRMTAIPGVGTRRSAARSPPNQRTVPAIPSSAAPATSTGILAKADET